KRDRAMLELLYATGMRVSELVSLDIEKIYLEGKRPFVRCPGRRDDARDVPITRRCYDALVDYLESARPLMARNPDERALFVNTRGGRMTRQGFWFVLKGYARAVGGGVKITPHTLRHSFAAHKLGGGEPRGVRGGIGAVVGGVGPDWRLGGGRPTIGVHIEGLARGGSGVGLALERGVEVVEVRDVGGGETGVEDGVVVEVALRVEG